MAHNCLIKFKPQVKLEHALACIAAASGSGSTRTSTASDRAPKPAGLTQELQKLSWYLAGPELEAAPCTLAREVNAGFIPSPAALLFGACPAVPGHSASQQKSKEEQERGGLSGTRRHANANAKEGKSNRPGFS